MTYKLQIEGVHKSYGSVCALHPASIDVREGEFLTLLGPSGSGKSTLLMIVAGLQLPDGGMVRIGGKEATYAPPFRRDIGMVFQNYALFPHLSIAENIAFPLRRRRVPEDEIRRKVGEVLEIVHLSHVSERRPPQLSGGQQQRIALARCLVYSPSIILMDEPLGALDKKLRDQLQIEIKRLHAELGTTILYVTHDQQETLTMSDRVCLMSAGRIEQIAGPKEIYFQPATRFAADFLGESNIFSGTIERSGAMVAVRVPALGGKVVPVGRDLPQGTRVAIMIRPESLQPVGRPDGAAQGNRLDATVVEAIFCGTFTRYLLQTREQTAVVMSTLTGQTPLAPGQQVAVGWETRAIAVILDEPEGAQ